MDDDYGYDDTFMDYDDDQDWIYFEDDYALSDELAENQVSSPGYSGTNYAIEMESFELDLYGYWIDIQYGDDAYWEKDQPGTANENGPKRKRLAPKATHASDKRRKTDIAHHSGNNLPLLDLEPVRFESRKERDLRYLANPPLLTERVSFAFMPDWRERFADVDGSLSSKPMPADMERAAQSEASPGPSLLNPTVCDEDNQPAESENSNDSMPDLDLDPDMLKSILRQKLGESGLEGMDESMLMQIIAQMISGEGDAEGAIGQLANSLLSNISEERNEEGLEDWLKQQGVAIHDDEDASSVNTEAIAEESGNTSQRTSRVVDTVNSESHGGTRKRKSSVDDQDHINRKKVAVDASSQDRVTRGSRTTQHADGDHASLESAGGLNNKVKPSKSVSNKYAPSHHEDILAENATSVAEAKSSQYSRKRKAIDTEAGSDNGGTKRTKNASRTGTEPESTSVSKKGKGAKVATRSQK